MLYICCDCSLHTLWLWCAYVAIVVVIDCYYGVQTLELWCKYLLFVVYIPYDYGIHTVWLWCNTLLLCCTYVVIEVVATEFLDWAEYNIEFNQ